MIVGMFIPNFLFLIFGIYMLRGEVKISKKRKITGKMVSVVGVLFFITGALGIYINSTFDLKGLIPLRVAVSHVIYLISFLFSIATLLYLVFGKEKLIGNKS
jgi:uncharacterized membrane protein YfcA